MHLEPDTVAALFAGLERTWLLIGPVVGGIVGALLAAGMQRRSESQRRRYETFLWTRDARIQAYKRLMSATADLGRAGEFMLWWTYQVKKGSFDETAVRDAVEGFNEADREMRLAIEGARIIGPQDIPDLATKARMECRVTITKARAEGHTAETLLAMRQEFISRLDVHRNDLVEAIQNEMNLAAPMQKFSVDPTI